MTPILDRERGNHITTQGTEDQMPACHLYDPACYLSDYVLYDLCLAGLMFCTSGRLASRQVLTSAIRSLDCKEIQLQRDARDGDPGGTRTPYLQIRNLSLYPDELRDHKSVMP